MFPHSTQLFLNSWFYILFYSIPFYSTLLSLSYPLFECLMLISWKMLLQDNTENLTINLLIFPQKTLKQKKIHWTYNPKELWKSEPKTTSKHHYHGTSHSSLLIFSYFCYFYKDKSFFTAIVSGISSGEIGLSCLERRS